MLNHPRIGKAGKRPGRKILIAALILAGLALARALRIRREGEERSRVRDAHDRYA